MWSDNETTLDLLGFRVHADLIRSVVTNPDLLPVTLGVFGDWGGGKTSIMKMLESDLDPENYTDPDEKAKYEKIACLYFNGWLFEGYDDAKSAIISSVLLQLGEHQRFGPRVRTKIVSLMKSINWMRAARLGFKEVALPAVAAYITGGATIVPSLMKSAVGLAGFIGADEISEGPETAEVEEASDASKIDWEKLIKSDKTPASPMDVRSFRERFSQMLKDSDIHGLVIMVDDLDRCSPKRIIENLEAIKLFLNVDNTAFVIGADPRIVRHAIAVTYTPDQMKGQEASESAESLITDYLEKLIQVPYRLPRLSPAEVETYMTLLFCQRMLDSDLFDKCVACCREVREENRYSVFGYADVEKAIDNNLPDELSRSLAFSNQASPLITEGLKGNPRQIKRFLNAYVLRKELAKVAKLNNIRDDVLVKLMILEYAHMKEFKDLFNWQQADDGFPKQIEEWEKLVLEAEGDIAKLDDVKVTESRWNTKSIKRWLAMEPLLSDIDLRDYFWIARDRLESTLSGTALIPPIVRTAFSDILSDNNTTSNNAVETVQDFNDDERVAFLDLLEDHIKRHTDETTGYKAFDKLIRNDIPGGVEAFVNALSTAPIKSVPAPFGYDLARLIQEKPQVKDKFDATIQRMMSRKSRIKTALEKALGIETSKKG
jgi:predicted KAP-like P-loop ATPase